MDNQTKPKYWNERTQSDGRTAVVHRKYDTNQMKRVTDEWWETLRPYLIGSGDVLEVGCGWGRWADKISTVADSYTGVDVCKELVNRSQPEHDIRLIEPCVLPFDANSFDVVVTITVLQHITDVDMEKTIAEMNRVLKDGGRVLCVENTTDCDGFRSVPEYTDALSVTKQGEISENDETMSILEGGKT